VTPAQITPEKTRRFLVMMWVALVASVGVYYFLTTTLQPANPDPNSVLVFPLVGMAVLVVLASVYCKARFGAREGQTRSTAMVRAAYIIALTLDESAAILGLVVYLLSGWPQYWLLFVLSGAGFILNFPRRDDFEQVGRNA
jgi:hypothetical protein